MLERRVLLAAIPVVNWVHTFEHLHGADMVMDGQGYLYIAGSVVGGQMTGGFDSSYGGNGQSDGFVAKFRQNGTMVWGSYLGGSGSDNAQAIALDQAGNVYVTGVTESAGWVSGGPDTTLGGTTDGFLAKVRPDGSLAWSTYFGGSEDDLAEAMAVDSTGTVYLAGRTSSADLARNGYDTTYDAGNGVYEMDVFAARIEASGSIAWSTYLGGADNDLVGGVAIDPSGSIYVTGFTGSTGWTSSGADTTHNGDYDGYLVKLTPTGGLAWSTYIGGEGHDRANALAVDPQGGVYVGGEIGLVAARYTTWDGEVYTSYQSDGYVAKFGSGGQLLSTANFGGDDNDEIRDVTLDATGRLFVVGCTYSEEWMGGGLGDNAHGPPVDGFAAEVKPDGTMVWGTYLGANGYDFAGEVVVDAYGAVYVQGSASSVGWANGALYENEPDYWAYGSYIARITTAEAVQVTGTDGPDEIEIRREGEEYVLTFNGVETRYETGAVPSFIVRSGLGDDVVTIGEEVALPVAVYSREGNDTIVAGSGPTSLYAGTGDDLLIGGVGHDVLEGGEGNDTMQGGGGKDTLYGHAGNDFMEGGAGDDEIYGNGDNDTLLGGEGNDFLTGNTKTNYVFGGAGDDTLRSSGGTDYPIAGPELSTSVIRDGWHVGTTVGTLSAADDASIQLTYELVAGTGDSDNSAFTIVGNELRTAATFDREAKESYSIHVRAKYLYELYWPVSIERVISLQVVAAPDVQEIAGTAGNDVIRVSVSGDNYVFDVNGQRTEAPVAAGLVVNGLAGDDLIELDASWDAQGVTIYGGEGNDTIRGSAGADSIYGNLGDDVVRGRLGEDSVMGGLGADLIDGQGGSDKLWGGDGTDRMYGGDGNDYIEGKGKADTIYGGTGHDWILGQAGNDLIYGQAGDDLIEVHDGQSPVFTDTVHAGLGMDSVSWDVLDRANEWEVELSR